MYFNDYINRLTTTKVDSTFTGFINQHYTAYMSYGRARTNDHRVGSQHHTSGVNNQKPLKRSRLNILTFSNHESCSTSK